MKAGVDPLKVFEAINGGLRQASPSRRRKGPHDVRRQLQARLPHRTPHQGPRQRPAHGHNLGVPIPLSAHIMEMMHNLKPTATSPMTTAASSSYPIPRPSHRPKIGNEHHDLPLP